MNFIKPPREKDLQPDEGFRRGEEGRDEHFNFLTRYHATQLIFKVPFAWFAYLEDKGNVYSLFIFYIDERYIRLR